MAGRNHSGHTSDDQSKSVADPTQKATTSLDIVITPPDKKIQVPDTPPRIMSRRKRPLSPQMSPMTPVSVRPKQGFPNIGFHTPDRPTSSWRSPKSDQEMSSPVAEIAEGFGRMLKPAPPSDLLGWGDMPSSPKMDDSIRAYRGSPATFDPMVFVGGNIRVDTTPDHGRFRRSMARTFHNDDDQPKENE